MRPPKPPDGLSAPGRALWEALAGSYELAAHELRLLHEACRCADRLDALAEVVAADGPTLVTSKGDVIAHPALVESRQQQVVFSRLLASLRLPDEGEVRPQRRGAARGSYPRAVD